MTLVGDWEALERTLPADWGRARVELTVGEQDGERAASFLAPAQPYRSAPHVLRFDTARDGSAAGTTAIRRLLARLDSAGVGGSLVIVSSESAEARAEAANRTLAQSWDDALATVPADWSDLVGEIDLISSDYLDVAALNLAPINPRLVADTVTLRFRSAQTFGYGASPGMVRRCLERCDARGVRGSVRVVRVLSDTRPVATQGPVWQIGGRTV
ncbi:MAG: hypothetical protein JO064_10825 [Actinobacteria bacterium]|nr:hypothetical protein [Actinomycetota bacterium]